MRHRKSISPTVGGGQFIPYQYHQPQNGSDDLGNNKVYDINKGSFGMGNSGNQPQQQ
jgi:hypothetical protein